MRVILRTNYCRENQFEFPNVHYSKLILHNYIRVQNKNNLRLLIGMIDNLPSYDSLNVVKYFEF